jgi:taspase (threonine aspartase 1)
MIQCNFSNLYYFAESPFLHGVEEKIGGLILIKCFPNDDTGEFVWTHSSKTMCVSYMGDAERRPMVLYSLVYNFCICSLHVNMKDLV